MREKENIIKTLKVMIDALKKASKIDYAEIKITPETKELDAIGVGFDLKKLLPKRTGWIKINFDMRYKVV